MYTFANNTAVMILSRIISGCGTGGQAAFYGTVSKNTPAHKRTAAFTTLIMVRYIGQTVGPVWNLAFLNINFPLFGYKIDSLRFVGVSFFVIDLWCNLKLGS